VHCVVPGGGLSPDYQRWVGCKPGFFLPVRVLSRLFRRLFLQALEEAFSQGKLHLLGELEPLADASAWVQYLSPCKDCEWVVYAKPPFGGPQQALAYLGRYTHRVALSNERIQQLHQGRVTFQWKDYRSQHRDKSRSMTLNADEFIRRFLIHTLPPGFQRIRHFGFLTNCRRQQKLAVCRKLLHPVTHQWLPTAAQCTLFLLALIAASQTPSACPRCRRGVMIRMGFVPAYPWPTNPPDTS